MNSFKNMLHSLNFLILISVQIFAYEYTCQGQICSKKKQKKREKNLNKKTLVEIRAKAINNKLN